MKFKATEIENEIGQNLQMEFYANAADHEKSSRLCPISKKGGGGGGGVGKTSTQKWEGCSFYKFIPTVHFYYASVTLILQNAGMREAELFPAGCDEEGRKST